MKRTHWKKSIEYVISNDQILRNIACLKTDIIWLHEIPSITILYIYTSIFTLSYSLIFLCVCCWTCVIWIEYTQPHMFFRSNLSHFMNLCATKVLLFGKFALPQIFFSHQYAFIYNIDNVYYCSHRHTNTRMHTATYSQYECVLNLIQKCLPISLIIYVTQFLFGPFLICIKTSYFDYSTLGRRPTHVHIYTKCICIHAKL